MKHFLFVAFLGLILSQTTGKISGYVIDADSSNPIVGANIVIKDTSLGTASDEDGIFYIINLSPGTYTVECSVIGYERKIIEDLRVSVNRTTPLKIELDNSLFLSN